MEKKLLKNNGIEMRDQINEWWDDLMDEEQDLIDGDQELVRILHKRYGYIRNLDFMEIEKRRRHHPEAEVRKNRANSEEWRDSNDARRFPGAGAKNHPRRSGNQHYEYE